MNILESDNFQSDISHMSVERISSLVDEISNTHDSIRNPKPIEPKLRHREASERILMKKRVKT